MLLDGGPQRKALGVQRYVCMGSPLHVHSLQQRRQMCKLTVLLLIVSLKLRAFPLESVVFGKGACSSIQLRLGRKGISLSLRLCRGLSP